MSNVIIFGSRRLGISDIQATNEKYPNSSVVTIEPSKKGGKSRRVLFNKSAALLLGLEEGTVNNIVFGSVIREDGGVEVLLANADSIDAEDLTTYKTSKNRVSYDGTKEKGKAISSTTISREISGFLDLDDEAVNEFVLDKRDTEGIESFSMKFMDGTTSLEVEVAVDNVDVDYINEIELVEEEELIAGAAFVPEDHAAYQAEQDWAGESNSVVE